MSRSPSAPFVIGIVASAALALVSAVVACSTDDPRAGTRNTGSGGTSSSSGTTSSSGGIDATAPDAPIDCGPAPGANAPFSKQALLAAASKCAEWHACSFVNAATALRTSVHDQASAPSAEKLAAARTAWKTAMNEWSKMELFQFGPSGNTVIDPYHGRGLRSFVHPWPQTSRCEVEKQIASKDWKQGVNTVLPAGRGLFALEYVLHYEGADTACLPATPTGQAWAALSPADLATGKNDYAKAVADNVVGLALELRNVWLPEGENFQTKLASFDRYGSEQETLNVVAWSLFYPEKEIKDWKLASRAGVATTAPNPETPFGLVEIENIRTNLRTFRSLFQGCGADYAGVGFDDWLIAAGQEPFANEILAALAQAQAAADAFPAFGQATQEQFKAFYDAIKPLSDLLKTRFFGSASPLNLKLPASAASDTD
ncbi:MAG: putative Iron-regulated protein precursor [Labilithrix sp.]|nr:putative Iron-regulated protein precursor [Labilithrix sp.]